MKNIKKSLLTLIFGAGACAALLTSCGETKFTYEFNVDGGTAIENMSVKQGDTITLPTATKDGYLFLGWYDNAECTGEPITTASATGNLTFYAKWEKLYTVTLNTNGGTLTETEVELRNGANVYDALKNLTPTKSGVKFAGWYINGKKVAENTVIAAADITAEAKYSQTVTVEYYKEDLAEDCETKTYTKSVVTDEAIVGTTYTPASVEGFTQVTTEDTVASVTVSEDASKNVAKVYLDRNEYTVTYVMSYPDGQESEEYADQVKYGDTYELQEFFADGAVLVGFATEADGEVVYSVDFYKNEIQNVDAQASEASIDVNKNVTLYPVWNIGYKNMFEGEDYIYLIDGEIYLERGNEMFKGTYTADTNEFYFENAAGDIFLQGKLNADKTFSYASDVRANKSYNLFVSYVGLNTYVTLYFDSYNGCKYVVTDSETGLQSVSNGSYVVNEDNTFTATFTDGDMADKTINFKVGTVSSKAAFQVRDDELYDLGALPIFYVNGTIVDINPNATLTFNGYGSATLSTTTYYAQYDSETKLITLKSTSDSSVAGVLKLVDVNGTVGVALYYEDYNHTYTSGTDTLVLDGLYNATYTTADGVVTGLYKTSSSLLGKTVVTVTDEYGLSYKFMLDETTSGETTVYSYSVLDADNYFEMYYSNGSSAYYAPLLVIESATDAKVYYYLGKDDDGNAQFEVALTGTYAKNDNGRFTFTVTNCAVEKAETIIADLATLSSFEFGVTTFTSSSTTLYVNFWYSYTTKGEEGAKTELTKTYKYIDSNGKVSDSVAITTVNNYVILSTSSGSAIGSYATNDGYIKATIGSYTYYFVLDEEASTFKQITGPYTQYEYKDGTTNKNEYIDYTADGKLTYNVVGDEETATYTGTVTTLTETTIGGSPIYQFTSTDGTITFKFILLQNSTSRFFAKYNAAYDVALKCGTTTFTLDGFGFQLYAAEDGSEDSIAYTYTYTVAEDGKTAVLTIKTGTYDVDLTTKTCTLRDDAYGTYLVMDNNAFTEYVTLDGHGKAELFKYVDKEKVTIANGTYMLLDDHVFIYYTIGEKEDSIYAEIGTYTSSSTTYHALYVEHIENLNYYVDLSDFSVLWIYSTNTTKYYDKNGVLEEGKATFISDNMIYYVNDASSNATIIVLDPDTHTMTPASYKLKGYYTSDFESLIFYSYGFVVENGSSRAYYYMDDYDEVTLFRYEPENADANEYGYVEEAFGEFADHIKYNNKDYYINTGYSIEFKRTTANVGKYPLLSSDGETAYNITSLYFAPTGLEFSVSGQATVTAPDGTTSNISVTVTREKQEDGTYKMYATYGSYIFGITATYGGVSEDGTSASSFEVISESYVLEMKAYQFAYLVYLYYMYYGVDYSSYADPYGGLQVTYSYGEDGIRGDGRLTSTFVQGSSSFVDSNGKVLVFDTTDFTMTLMTNSSGTQYYVIKAQTVGSDGYTYRITADCSYFSTFSMYYCYVTTIERKASFTDNDGYTINLWQYVTVNETSDTTSDKYGAYIGKIHSVSYSKGEEDIDLSALVVIDNNYYMVIRTTDDNEVVTGSKYLLISYETKAVTEGLAPVITSAKVSTTYEMTVKYTEDGKTYVEIFPDGTLASLYVDGSYTSFKLVSYDAATKTYTITVTNSDSTTTNYTIVVSDSGITMTEVTAPAADE